MKQGVVEEREYKDTQLKAEYVAEFTYRPTKCCRDHRVVVVRKELCASLAFWRLVDRLERPLHC